MNDGRRLPSIAAGVEIADFDTELVVLVPGDRRAVHLQAGHAIVLDSCRRGHGIDRLVADMSAASDEPPESIRRWTLDVVQELARLGIVENASATESPPARATGDPAGRPAPPSIERDRPASGRSGRGSRGSAR